MPRGRPRSKSRTIKRAFSLSPHAWGLLRTRPNKSFVVDQLIENFIHLVKPSRKRRDANLKS